MMQAMAISITSILGVEEEYCKAWDCSGNNSKKYNESMGHGHVMCKSIWCWDLKG